MDTDSPALPAKKVCCADCVEAAAADPDPAETTERLRWARPVPAMATITDTIGISASDLWRVKLLEGNRSDNRLSSPHVFFAQAVATSSTSKSRCSLPAVSRPTIGAFAGRNNGCVVTTGIWHRRLASLRTEQRTQLDEDPALLLVVVRTVGEGSTSCIGPAANGREQLVGAGAE